LIYRTDGGEKNFGLLYGRGDDIRGGGRQRDDFLSGGAGNESEKGRGQKRGSNPEAKVD